MTALASRNNCSGWGVRTAVTSDYSVVSGERMQRMRASLSSRTYKKSVAKREVATKRPVVRLILMTSNLQTLDVVRPDPRNAPILDH